MSVINYIVGFVLESYSWDFFHNIAYFTKTHFLN